VKLAKYKRYLRIARANEYWTRMRWLAMKNPTWGMAYWQVTDHGAYMGITRAEYANPSDTVAARSKESS
jgi:hypothetical protein